jgi:hypothetical protein
MNHVKQSSSIILQQSSYRVESGRRLLSVKKGNDVEACMLVVRCLAAAAACPPIEMESEWTLVPFFTFHFTREREE